MRRAMGTRCPESQFNILLADNGKPRHEQNSLSSLSFIVRADAQGVVCITARAFGFGPAEAGLVHRVTGYQGKDRTRHL